MFKWSISILIFIIISSAAAYVFYFKPLDKKTDLKKPVSAPVTSAIRSLVLEINEPEGDVLVYGPDTKVSGKTSPNVSVVVSTDSQDLLLHSDSEGNFSANLTLTPGVNKITVTVIDSNEDKKSETRVIYYSKEKLQ